MQNTKSEDMTNMQSNLVKRGPGCLELSGEEDFEGEGKELDEIFSYPNELSSRSSSPRTGELTTSQPAEDLAVQK